MNRNEILHEGLWQEGSAGGVAAQIAVHGSLSNCLPFIWCVPSLPQAQLD